MTEIANARLSEERKQLLDQRAKECGVKPAQIVRVWERLFGGLNYKTDSRFMEWLRSDRCTSDIAAELG